MNKFHIWSWPGLKLTKFSAFSEGLKATNYKLVSQRSQNLAQTVLECKIHLHNVSVEVEDCWQCAGSHVDLSIDRQILEPNLDSRLLYTNPAHNKPKLPWCAHSSDWHHGSRDSRGAHFLVQGNVFKGFDVFLSTLGTLERTITKTWVRTLQPWLQLASKYDSIEASKIYVEFTVS
jgi:hypothetical protein